MDQIETALSAPDLITVVISPYTRDILQIPCTLLSACGTMHWYRYSHIPPLSDQDDFSVSFVVLFFCLRSLISSLFQLYSSLTSYHYLLPQRKHYRRIQRVISVDFQG